MKFRTAEILYDFLDDDMAWRIKEINELRASVRLARGGSVDTHIRAGIAMLYAHWEGFVKEASNAYVGYLAWRADPMRKLKPCFMALSMKEKLRGAEASAKSTVATLAISFLLDGLDKPIQLPKSDAISTQSNLSSLVFVNIAGWIGLDISRYEPRFNLIDKTLLATRNAIAHGNYLSIDEKRFDDLVFEVLEILRWFKTDIQNAVSLQSYLMPASADSVL